MPFYYLKIHPFTEIVYDNTGCTANTDCATVGAICGNGKCVCAPSKYINTATNQCLSSTLVMFNVFNFVK